MPAEQTGIEDVLRRAYADLADTVHYHESHQAPAPARPVRWSGAAASGSPGKRPLIPVAAGLAVVLVVILARVVPGMLQSGSRQEPAAPAPRDMAYIAAGDYDGTGRSSVIPVRVTSGTPLPAIPLTGTTGGPAGMAITPDGRTVYVVTTHGQVTQLSTATGTAAPPISIGGTPDSLTTQNTMVMTADGRTGYVLEAPYGVAVVNLAASRAAGFIKIHGAQGFAITPDGKTLYVTSLDGSTVTPVDTQSNTVLRAIRTGLNRMVAYITIAPDGKTAYVTGARGQPAHPSSGVIVPIRTATNTALPPITSTVDEPMTISPDSKTGYLPAYDGVMPVNLITDTEGKLIKLPMSQFGYQLVISPSGRTLYALPGLPLKAGTNQVFPITTATDATQTPIRLGSASRWIADGEVFGPDGQTLYVLFYPNRARGEAGLMVPVNTANGLVAKPIHLAGVALYTVSHR